MENIESQNTTPTESEEVEAGSNNEISAEEREQLEDWLDTLSHRDESTLGNPPLRRMLYQKGVNVAPIIVEKIRACLSDEHPDSYKVWRCASWLEYAATEVQSGDIADLLGKEKILLNPDRSSKITLLRTLGRIGKAEDIKTILGYFENIQSNEEKIYGNEDSLLQSDAMDVLNAVVDIKSKEGRFSDVEVDLVSALARINATLAKALIQPIGEEELGDRFMSAVRERADFEESMNPPTERPGHVFNINPDNYSDDADSDDETGNNDDSDSYDDDAQDVDFAYHMRPQNTERGLWERPPFDEETREDEELLLEFTRNEFSGMNDRLETIRNLRKSKKKEGELSGEEAEHDKALLSRHFLELRETQPTRYTPTLGIEIEVRDEAVMPPEQRFHYKSFQEEDAMGYGERLKYRHEAEQYTANRDILRKPFDEAEKAGIPNSFDKFWEFAHKPVTYYATLSREVQSLMELGLLNQTYQKYPLHLTVGGVAARGKDRGETFLLARALEGTGWSTRERRLLRTYYAKRETWTCKGEGGIKDRHAADKYKLEFGTKEAAEIRTFQLQTLSGLERLLKSAFFLGAALRAFQKGAILERLSTEKKGGRELDETEKRLADIWQVFSERTKNLFAASNLKDPSATWENPNPRDETRSSEFVPFARLLGEAEEDPKSHGTEFVREMRKLVIEARKEAKNVIYPALVPEKSRLKTAVRGALSKLGIGSKKAA